MLEARRGQSAEERARATTRTFELAGAASTDPSTGRPVGYPPGFPLIAGYEPLAGGVDPGVIRTSTLLYPLPARTLGDRLASSAAEAGFTLVDREETETGTLRLRFERGGMTVSAAIRPDGPRSALHLIAPRAR